MSSCCLLYLLFRRPQTYIYKYNNDNNNNPTYKRLMFPLDLSTRLFDFCVL